MPEFPVNKALTPREALTHVFHKIDRLIADGICSNCAVYVIADEYGIDRERLSILFLSRWFDGYED